jgi:hypothetical protein
MKKMLFAASTAALALSGFATPAYAAIDPTYGGESPDLDAACNALLNPDDSSKFTTYAYDVDERTDVVRTLDSSVTTPEGMATTTLGDFKRAHVNGQSVNIHADRDVTVTYLDGTKTVKTFKVVTTKVATGTCHVHKTNVGTPNPDSLGHEGYISPGGLNGGPPSQDAPVDLSGEPVTTFETETTFDDTDFVDLNASGTKEFVICISPSQPPPKGTWKGQNGYISQLGRTCSTIWHDELGSSQPTASLPPA